MENTSIIEKKAYQLAMEYLLTIPSVTTEVIEEYQHPKKAKSIEEIYQSLLESAQNRSMITRVIGGSIGGVKNLKIVLENFDPSAVLDKYGDRHEAILDDIVKQLEPRGKNRREPGSSWPHFCQTVLSAANFIEQFKSADDFYKWADFFDIDDRTRAALALLLSLEIYGIGFVLACDFFKELGYINFPKPDGQLRYIFTGLNLCDKKSSDYQLFKSIVRVAKNAGVTPYAADKVFWLIGSGRFDLHKHIGKNGSIGNHKDKFITYAHEALNGALA